QILSFGGPSHGRCGEHHTGLPRRSPLRLLETDSRQSSLPRDLETVMRLRHLFTARPCHSALRRSNANLSVGLGRETEICYPLAVPNQLSLSSCSPFSRSIRSAQLKRAFTLIELLVVIAIIAILAS